MLFFHVSRARTHKWAKYLSCKLCKDSTAMPCHTSGPYCGPKRNLLTFSQVHLTADAVEIMVAQLFLCSCPEAIIRVSK